MSHICQPRHESIYYAQPIIGWGIKRCFCLTFDVCLSRIHRA